MCDNLCGKAKTLNGVLLVSGGVKTEMATVEEIVKKILLKRPELSRNDIMKSLETEKRKTGGYARAQCPNQNVVKDYFRRCAEIFS